MISALELQARGYEVVNAFTAPQAGLWHAGAAPVYEERRQARVRRSAWAAASQIRRSRDAELRGTSIGNRRIASLIEVLNLRNVNDVCRVNVAEDETLNRIDA